ncbi:MAG: hypothetical protein HQL46_07415 [Gammaproteobacteria bacterium]|nr:hypothetical protein [Gammaproteobacteria bacterium]
MSYIELLRGYIEDNNINQLSDAVFRTHKSDQHAVSSKNVIKANTTVEQWCIDSAKKHHCTPEQFAKKNLKLIRTIL